MKPADVQEKLQLLISADWTVVVATPNRFVPTAELSPEKEFGTSEA